MSKDQEIMDFVVSTTQRNLNLKEINAELLEALEAIIAEAGLQYGLDDGPGTVNTMARIARAAIAKARGAA